MNRGTTYIKIVTELPNELILGHAENLLSGTLQLHARHTG